MFLTCAAIQSSQAQSPLATPKPKVAFIRFWNMLPDPKKDTLDLYLANNQLLTSINGSGSSGYVPVLPNTYTLYVQRASDGPSNAPVKTPAIRMLDGSFFTILATMQSGQINLEVIDDTIDPKADDGSVKLVIRQFYPGARATVTVDKTPAVTVNYGETTTLDHLSAGQIPVAIQAVVTGGTPKTTTITGNYTKWHHGTLLIVGDLYGRFRPFFTVDGHSDLNLASVMERWLQANTKSPILVPPSSSEPKNDLVADAQKHSEKKHRKVRVKHSRRSVVHHKSEDTDRN